MNALGGLLAHYTNLFKSKQLELISILEVIKVKTGLNLTTEEVRLKDKILFLKTKSKYKLEVILRKSAILEQLNSSGATIVDIR